MEQEEVFANETANSPHFVDDSTLRGAQPVVSLAEIRSRTNGRSRLLITLALLLAVGLGAGVALLLVHIKQGGLASPAGAHQGTNAENPENSTVAVAGEDEEEMLDVAPADEAKTEAPATDKKMRPKPPAQARETANTLPPVKVEAENDVQQEPILVDQWQERRSRRVTRIERRRDNSHRRQDLFGIRDIFEGARP